MVIILCPQAQSLSLSLIMAASLAIQHAATSFTTRFLGTLPRFLYKAGIPILQLLKVSASGGTLLSRELSSANKSCLTWRLGGYITPPLPGSSRWPVTEWFKDTKVWSPWPQSGAILNCHSVTGVPCGNKIRLDCISTLIFTWLHSLFYPAPSRHCRCLPRALP